MLSKTDAVVTDEKVLETLRELVAERPDYVYSCPEHMEGKVDGGDAACFYVHTDEDGSLVSPGCAIGVALHRLGVDLESLADVETHQASVVVSRFFSELSRSTMTKLNCMQSYQDNGHTWGAAYVMATGDTI
ncbi:hypothetical protein ABT160_04725 [Streptomyces sp. NPDC001941]|uniref:hypothetical protein n=1 Tax=Streptomyces sp. NPDC001941 TaxID=3154659 RepID=UPI0033288D77